MHNGLRRLFPVWPVLGELVPGLHYLHAPKPIPLYLAPASCTLSQKSGWLQGFRGQRYPDAHMPELPAQYQAEMGWKEKRLGWGGLSTCGLCARQRTSEILNWNLMPLTVFVKEENILSVS